METVRKYTVEVSVESVVLETREDGGIGQFFVFLAPSRHLCDSWCVNGIKVLDSEGTPVYEAVGADVERHFIPTMCGTKILHPSARSRLCVGLAECARRVQQLDDDTAYAVAMEREAKMPRGKCTVACTVTADVWKAQLYLAGDFISERLYLQQEDFVKSQYNLCIMGRYEDEVWQYKPVGGVARKHSKSVYYNRGESNAWGDLDENDFFEALLLGSLPGEVQAEERAEFLCDVGRGGSVRFIGVEK